nr:hypothetical protein [uncultured bacterium]
MKIAFWNVGIKNKEKDRDLYTACIVMILESMIKHHEFDIIFLCEVDEGFTLNPVIISSLANNDISIINSAEKLSSKTSFDICAIYKKSKNTVTHQKYITYNNLDGGEDGLGVNLRIGAEFLVEDNTKDEKINIIISHWPSKLTPGYEFRHKDAAERLRIESEERIKEGKQVILMGDYNLSPHEMISNTNLKSYNNKFFALRSSLRMYNLSFNFFNQHSILFKEPEHRPALGFGTFISSKSRNTEIGCEVFDQAHVSSSFIESGPWVLDEEKTQIFHNRIISGLVYGQNIQLDHLPISLEIK